jgi:hypothetical protein
MLQQGHTISREIAQMNIKLVKIGDRWFVVVNSLSGEFKEDVTGIVMNIAANEGYEIAVKRLNAEKQTRLNELENAVADIVSVLSKVTDVHGS